MTDSLYGQYKGRMEELLIVLKKHGFTEYEAKDQVAKLTNIVLLETLKKLAEINGLNLKEIPLDSQADFLSSNFTDTEIETALESALEIEISAFIKSLNQEQ